MRVTVQRKPQGIALIIVMIVIIVLAVLAGGFAYSMKVETRLAKNSSFDSDMENLGRSGVELARYILAMHLRIPVQGAYTALNQKWANGPATTNELLVEINLDHNQLGLGEFSIRMIDMERRFNLSAIRDDRNSPILQRALEMIGVESPDVSTIVESYLDWVDPDDNKRIHGAESEFYATLNPAAPYVAKNGLMDDVSEFLQINGVTPEIFFGSGRTGLPTGNTRTVASTLGALIPATGANASVGLVDLFTTISTAGLGVNVNTAPFEVLKLLPGIDATGLDDTLARAIIDTRAGPDHTDGTEDDLPFEQRGDLGGVPGMPPGLLNMLSPYLVLQSSIFQVTVEARIGNYVRRYEALLHRRNAQDVAILYFRWL
jgi:type II secretory pathway component PulK